MAIRCFHEMQSITTAMYSSAVIVYGQNERSEDKNHFCDSNDFDQVAPKLSITELSRVRCDQKRKQKRLMSWRKMRPNEWADCVCESVVYVCKM